MKKNRVIAVVLCVIMLATCIPFAVSAEDTTGTGYREGTTLVSMNTMLKRDLNDSGTYKASGVQFTNINMVAAEMDGPDPSSANITNQNGHFVIGDTEGISYRLTNHSGLDYNVQSKKIGTNTNLPFNANTKYTISFDIQPSAYSLSKVDRTNCVGLHFTEADGTNITNVGGDTRWDGYGWAAIIAGPTSSTPRLVAISSQEINKDTYENSSHINVSSMWKYTSSDANSNGTIEPDEITDIEYTHFDFELDGYTMKIYVEGIPYAEWTMRSGQYETIGDTLGLYLWSRWADYGNTGDEQFRMKDLVVKAGNVVGRQTISFDQPNSATMVVGQNQQLVVNEGTATFTSSEPTVASVTSDGKLTALKKGEAVITITVGEQTTTCNVTVTLDTSSIDNMITAINTFRSTVGVTDNPCGEEDNQPYVSVAIDKAMNDAIEAAKLAAESALTNEDVQETVDTLNDAYDAFKTGLKFGEHTWDDGEVTKEPTVDSAGEKNFTCTKCGATKTERIKKLKASKTTPADTSAIGSETTNEQDTGGCGSYIGFGGAALIAVSLCGAIFVGKKKRDN